MGSKLAAYLAANIQKLREKRGLSQLQLAKQAGIPRTTLTNVESGAGNPSLTNLARISEALGVGIEELLSRPRSDCVLIPADKVAAQSRAQGQARVYKLLPDRVKGIEMDRVEFAPGALMGGHPHLVGTKEYLTVLKGELSVVVSGDSFVVREGDVLAFPGNQPHAYRNPSRSTTIAMSVVIPIPALV